MPETYAKYYPVVVRTHDGRRIEKQFKTIGFGAESTAYLSAVPTRYSVPPCLGKVHLRINQTDDCYFGCNNHRSEATEYYLIINNYSSVRVLSSLIPHPDRAFYNVQILQIFRKVRKKKEIGRCVYDYYYFVPRRPTYNIIWSYNTIIKTE